MNMKVLVHLDSPCSFMIDSTNEWIVCFALDFLHLHHLSTLPFPLPQLTLYTLPIPNQSKIKETRRENIEQAITRRNPNSDPILSPLGSIRVLESDTSLYRFELQAHALGREELGRDARRAERAPRAVAELARPVQSVPHEEELHGDQHCMWLLFCHHRSTSLDLHTSLKTTLINKGILPSTISPERLSTINKNRLQKEE